MVTELDTFIVAADIFPVIEASPETVEPADAKVPLIVVLLVNDQVPLIVALPVTDIVPLIVVLPVIDNAFVPELV